MISTSGFALYRLMRGPYAGWRIRDVWRNDPEALMLASLSPETGTRDAAMIGLFLTLFGGLTYRPVTPATRVNHAALASLPEQVHRS